MNISSTLGALCLALSLGFAGTPQAAPLGAAATPTSETAASAAPQLHQAMRTLWHGHIVQTRLYALAVEAGDKAAAQRATDDAVANAKDIAAAVAGFYGEEGGAALLDLLAGHWQGVKDLTDSRHANSPSGMDSARSELSQNADAIATFLASANPNLTHDAVYGLMQAHIGFHAGQVNQIMAHDFVAEASTWESMQGHMDMFSDALADAIARQFPDQAS